MNFLLYETRMKIHHASSTCLLASRSDLN